jgi:predicted amidohydrolase
VEVDAADLFCRLYDDFETPHLDPYLVDDWLTDLRIQDIASFTEGQVVETGTLDSEEVQATIELADDEADKRRFAYLQGIDQALLQAHPHTRSHDSGGLTKIATRYLQTGKFNTDAAPGALLPRFAFPREREEEAAERLADALVSVVRVPAETWEKTEHVRVRPESDFNRLNRERGVVFGCVPFVEDLTEFEWSRREVGNLVVFQAEIKAEEEVRQRIAAVLRALDEQGAMVGVIPELCLSETVLCWWRQAIDENPPPPGSDLRWLLVGTGSIGGAGSNAPSNTAVLLDRHDGEALMVQSKLFPFSFRRAQIDSWGMEPFVGPRPAREDITRGETITVGESAIGRASILICEDLARTMEIGPSLREHGLSHAIAPVFSEPTDRHHWEHNKAKDYADQVGASVVVANSRAVGRNQGQTVFGTALAHSPFGTAIGNTSAPDEVVLLRVSDESVALELPRTLQYDDDAA